MPRFGIVFGVLALILAGTAGSSPASAEFFGCNTPRTTVSYSSQPYGQAYRSRHSRRYTHELAAQSSRHVTYSRYRRSPDRWR